MNVPLLCRYLPALFALLLLVSCHSERFTSRRYTHGLYLAHKGKAGTPEIHEQKQDLPQPEEKHAAARTTNSFISAQKDNCTDIAALKPQWKNKQLNKTAAKPVAQHQQKFHSLAQLPTGFKKIAPDRPLRYLGFDFLDGDDQISLAIRVLFCMGCALMLLCFILLIILIGSGPGGLGAAYGFVSLTALGTLGLSLLFLFVMEILRAIRFFMYYL